MNFCGVINMCRVINCGVINNKPENHLVLIVEISVMSLTVHASKHTDTVVRR